LNKFLNETNGLMQHKIEQMQSEVKQQKTCIRNAAPGESFTIQLFYKVIKLQWLFNIVSVMCKVPEWDV
jgi:hypothetical protein